MSEAKHTPGPWEVDDIVAEVVTTEGGNSICGLLWPTKVRSEAETEANARLIAAAPELIAALEPFAAFACEPDEGPHCDCPNCKARDLVAKAKGGSE